MLGWTKLGNQAKRNTMIRVPRQVIQPSDKGRRANAQPNLQQEPIQNTCPSTVQAPASNNERRGKNERQSHQGYG
jgi:hypothetical protein